MRPVAALGLLGAVLVACEEDFAPPTSPTLAISPEAPRTGDILRADIL